MKRIMLHLEALLIVAPFLLLVLSDSLALNTFGVVYLVYIVCFVSQSPVGRRFFRSYYHELLRIDNMM